MPAEGAAGAPLDTLRWIATRFGLAHDAVKDGKVIVVVDGLPVHVFLTIRSVGSTSTKWTVVGVRECDMPGANLQWHFAIRPTRPGDARDVSAGYLRDIVFGDEPFDRAFVVEAAPEDAVRALLDDDARRELVALAPLSLSSTKAHGIEIECEGWTEPVDTLERIVRLVARLAASLGPAAHAAAEERRRAAMAKGYRDVGLTREAVQRERAADIRAFRDQRARREQRDRHLAMVGLVLALLAVLGMIAGISWLVDYGRAHNW
jgi:hypothetical protein